MSSDLKIPKDRVGVLIGTKGVTKRLLEKKLRVYLKVSKDGEVVVEGDAFDCMIALKVVKAIGRGFNPVIALLLMQDDHMLEILDMKDFARSDADIHRIKSRVIGAEGKAWKILENLLQVDMSVYGHTVAFIGKAEFVDLARLAMEKLMRGAPHGKVYMF